MTLSDVLTDGWYLGCCWSDAGSSKTCMTSLSLTGMSAALAIPSGKTSWPVKEATWDVPGPLG